MPSTSVLLAINALANLNPRMNVSETCLQERTPHLYSTNSSSHTILKKDLDGENGPNLTHTYTHTHTNARTHPHMHTHTPTHTFSLCFCLNVDTRCVTFCLLHALVGSDMSPLLSFHESEPSPEPFNRPRGEQMNENRLTETTCQSEGHQM